jgi:hypothetical protein
MTFVVRSAAGDAMGERWIKRDLEMGDGEGEGVLICLDYLQYEYGIQYEYTLYHIHREIIASVRRGLGDDSKETLFCTYE